MPQLGESVAEGTIGKWLKKPGDHVAKYEPLLEVITDKVNAEVPSPFEGVLKEILVEEGATVPNNAEIAVIDEAGAGDASAAASDASRTPPGQVDGPAPSVAAGAQPTALASESAAPTPAAVAAPDETREHETPAPGHTDAAQENRTAASAPVAHGPAGSDERRPADINTEHDGHGNG